MNINVTVDNRATLDDIHRLELALPRAELKGMQNAVDYAVLMVPKFLKGPRPDHLDVKSGNLSQYISGVVEKLGNNVDGYIGTNVKSNKGFNYPEYWEESGSAHGGPRPFLRPTIETYNKQIWRQFNNGMDSVIEPIFRGHGK